MKKITKLIITVVIYILILIYFLVTLWKGGPIKPNKGNACEIFEVRLSNEIENYFAISLPKENGKTSKVSIGDLISEGIITSEDLKDIGTSCSGDAYVTKVGDNYYYYNDIACGKCSINNMYTNWSAWEETLPNFGDKKHQIMVNVLYNYSTTNSKETWTNWSDWGESIDKIKAPSMPENVDVVNTETQEKKQYRYRNATYKWYKLSSDIQYYNGNDYYSETAPSGYERLESSKRILRMTKAYSTQEELRSKENVKDGDEIKAVMGYKVRTTKYIYANTSSNTSSTYQVGDVSTSQSTAISTCKSQQAEWASTCVAYCSSSSGSTCNKYGYKYTITPKYLKNNGTTTTNRASADYLSDIEFNNLKKSNSSLSSYVRVGNPIYTYQTSEYIEGDCPTGLTCGTSVLYKAAIYEYKWYKTVSTNKTMCNNGALSSTSPGSGCIKDSSTTVWGEWSSYSDTEVKKTDYNEVEIKKLVRYRKSYISSKDLVEDKWYTYDEFESKTGKKIEDLREDKSVTLKEKIMYRYRVLK